MMNNNMLNLYSQETEQALISLALSAPLEHADLVQANDFFIKEHIEIWSAIQSLASKGQSVDVVTVNTLVKRTTQTDNLDYLIELNAMQPPAGSAETYAKDVREYAYSRHAVLATEKMNKIASSPTMGAAEKRAGLNQLNADLEAAMPEDYVVQDMFAAFDEKETQMERMRSGDIHPVMTGFGEVDDITHGMMGGEFIVVAGRPAMGKTAFVLNIAYNIAHLYGMGTHIFSLEMKGSELAGRLASNIGDIDGDNLRTGNLTKIELEAFANAKKIVGGMDIQVDDRAGLAVETMRAELRRRKRSGKPFHLVIVDYIQIANCLAAGDKRYDLITMISAAMKSMAKEFDVPVIALSQLGRECEKRADKRPMASDLRESGAIEQDADLIMLLYRDDVYHKDSAFPGQAEVIVAKHRAGSAGVAMLNYNGKYSRFENQDDSGDY